MALQECGALVGFEEGGAALEEWKEIMRAPLQSLVEGEEGASGGEEAREARMQGVKRKREERDVGDVREWKKWFEGQGNREFRRVAGSLPDTAGAVAAAGGGVGAVGVGGGRVQGEDFLQGLKRRSFAAGKAGAASGMGLVEAEGRLVGSVLGDRSRGGDERDRTKIVRVEGGPVGRVAEWKPRVQEVGPGWGRNDEGQGHSRGTSKSSGTLSEPRDTTLDDAEGNKRGELQAGDQGQGTTVTRDRRPVSAVGSPENAGLAL